METQQQVIVQEVAIQIRSVLRGKVGPRSERLVHYKVAPIRRRGGRSAPLALKPKGGEIVRTEPVVSAPPARRACRLVP
jgi:hypothetical protein